MKTLFSKLANLFLISTLVASLTLAGCGYTIQKSGSEKLGSYYPGTLTSQFPNYVYTPMVFTATSQTATQTLGGISFCTFSLTATALTTVTWIVKGSTDGGTNYYAIAVAPYVAGTLVPSTSAITSTSAPVLFVANLSGFTNFEIVTSGTFTATSVTITPTCSSNEGLVMNVG